VLTAAQERRLETTRRVARLLDSALRVPGTSFRFGLDPILGLVPGLGDAIPALFAVATLWQAYQLGIPRVVQARMLFNVAVDASMGLVPGLGDVMDAVWKANTRNLALLERHAYAHHSPSTGDKAFVIGLIGLVVASALVPVVLLIWFLTALSP
jgi:hypothetical protein